MKYHKVPCPSCKHENSFPFDESESCSVCSNCRTIYDVNRNRVNTSYSLLNQKGVFLLELGLTFTWEKEVYTITGYIIKQEVHDSSAVWVEYLLAHDELPNMYLSFFNGHWTVLKYLPEIQRKKGGVRNRYNMTFQKVEYDFQHNYEVKILDAQGSFNFPFYEDHGNLVREYVNYKEVLIYEENKKDEDLRFYLGSYLFSGEVNKCLNTKVKLPKRFGYLAYQPFYFPIDGYSFRWASALLILVMAICMAFWDTFFESKNLNEGRMSINTEFSNTLTSKPFEVKYNNSIIHLEAHVYNMSNDWVYADMALINTKTGEERYFEIEAEFYSGVEGGESWSEGSSEVSGNIQYVDAGTYILEATPLQAIGSVGKTIHFSLISQKGSWSVFWMLTLCVVIINVILALIGDYFNHKKRGHEYDTFSGDQ